MLKAAVVILNYNGREMLRQFLPSVLQNTALPYEVIVADNGSTDDSLAFLASNFPEVKVLASKENGGFSKGYNTALNQIEAEYYVLLNSDVEVTPNWIAPVIALMDSNPLIAACQPKIRSFQDKKSFEYAGAAGGFIDHFGYPFCRGRIFDTLEEDLGQYDDYKEIFWATGACMFVRADIYHQLGGLDEDFFAHMEEIDLCWRIKNAGYNVYYCPESTVYHLGGGTLHKSHPRKTFLNFRNGLVLLYKNLPSSQLYTTLFVRMVLDGIAAIKFLLGGGFKDFLAVLNAHFNFYKNLSLWKQKRRDCSQLKNIDSNTGILHKSLIWSYFVKRKNKFKEIKFCK
jgi:GT2 family glycosyltransferase